MAHKIQAWREFGPRLVAIVPMEVKEFINRLTRGVNQTKGTTISYMAEMDDILVETLCTGRTAKLPNGWTVRAIGKKDGTVDIKVSVGKEMLERVNRDFVGQWHNAQNFNKNEAEIVALWNEAHPEDPISLDDNPEPASQTGP
jgi:hypothetical protein